MRPCALAWVSVVLQGLSHVAAADYADEVRQDKPVAWWRFHDPATADGAATKDEMGGHDGAYRSGVTLDAGVPAIGGKAAKFNGKGACIEVPDHKDFALNTLSVEFWFKSTQAWNQPFWPGSATFVAKCTANNGSSDWTILGGSTREGDRQGCVVVGVGPKPGTDTLLNSPPRLNDGAWHHAVWTRSASGENKLYVDGGLAASAPDGGGAITNNRPIQIGADPYLSGKPLNGLIAEVAIYSNVLAATRVQAHAKAGGLTPKEWPMEPPPQDQPPFVSSVKPFVLRPEALQHYVETFNKNDTETVTNAIPNASAWAWMRENIPLFECPDQDIEEIYYFRWWTYRRQIKKTPDGFVVTEFLPPVGWAGKHNTINCAAGHHLYEGRWLHDPRVLDDYSVFWFRKGGDPRRYSFWAADAIYHRYLVTGNKALTTDLLGDLVANFEGWEKKRQDPNGLFWQNDGEDGMEVSIGGSGYRATISSYMFGDAMAIAQIAELAGKPNIADRFRAKAARIKQLVEEKLWDKDGQFFKVLPRGANAKLADVRELHGYTPWYFDLPDASRSIAWKQIMDPQGFYAPFGPTTAERRHPRFMFKHSHECLWNGPSWPYATSVTLTAMASLLNHYQQDFVGKKDYLDLLHIYAKSQHLKRPDGMVVPWIDEDLNPDTGEWIARSILEKRGVKDRGKDYNHSTYCDLVIGGLVGLRPRADDTLEVNPLVPEGAWDYFCLDGILYHGRAITILYDKTGQRYGKGAGLRVLADGKEIAVSEKIARVTAPLPASAVRRIRPPAGAQTAAGWAKYEGNPVLGGKLGTCFDIAVLREGEAPAEPREGEAPAEPREGEAPAEPKKGDTYRMWFSWRPKASVALVESADGIHWGEPLIVLGPNQATDWEADINRPGVLKRGGVYHMWYTGQARGHSWIGYATSPDGKTWKRMSDKPVLSPEKPWEKVALMCSQVLWDEQQQLYRMWYSGGEQYEPNAIGYATSPDGLTWTRHEANPVFTPDRAIAWERHKVTAGQVVRLPNPARPLFTRTPAWGRDIGRSGVHLEDGWFIMFYIGFRDEHCAQIGIARSRDGITDWERHPANPIISPGANQWDGEACYKPFALFDGHRWLLWYNGRRGSVEQIGLAIHDGEDLGF